MYQDEFTRLPTDLEDMWQLLEQLYYFAWSSLRMPVETREGASDDSFHIQLDNGEIRRDNLGSIRYRDISSDMDSLPHFLKIGNEALPIVREMLDKRALTGQFVQQWGILMYCYGYIDSRILDDSDPMAQKHAGMKGGRPVNLASHKWVAVMLIQQIDAGISKTRAIGNLEKYVRSRADQPDDEIFGWQWYKQLLSEIGLKATYTKLTVGQLRERAAIEAEIPDHPFCGRGTRIR